MWKLSWLFQGLRSEVATFFYYNLLHLMRWLGLNKLKLRKCFCFFIFVRYFSVNKATKNVFFLIEQLAILNCNYDGYMSKFIELIWCLTFGSCFGLIECIGNTSHWGVWETFQFKFVVDVNWVIFIRILWTLF